jgi:hypothetical protein
MIQALLVLFLSPNAFADDFICTPVAQIEPQVNYCDENPAFVAPAQACRDQYKALVKKTNEEIAANFAKLMRTANAKAQSGDFKTNQDLLASTEATLDSLIDRGFEIFDEMSDYQDDFVLPIYDAYREDFKVDPHTPAGRELFRGKECYAEPMEDIDSVKTELQSMILELEKTEEKAKQLHALSKSKESNLGSMTGKGAGGAAGNGGPGKPVPSGTSTNPPSTITGVDNAKKKDSEAAPAAQPGSNP